MSRWAIRMCSSKCQGVYGTFGGSRLMASSGKSATAASNGWWAPCPSMSARSCSRRMSLAAIWSLDLLYSSARSLTLPCSGPPGPRPLRLSPTMLPHRPSFVPVAACGDTMWSSCGVSVPRGRVRPVLARALVLQDDRVRRADPGLPSDPPEDRTREGLQRRQVVERIDARDHDFVALGFDVEDVLAELVVEIGVLADARHGLIRVTGRRQVDRDLLGRVPVVDALVRDARLRLGPVLRRREVVDAGSLGAGQAVLNLGLGQRPARGSGDRAREVGRRETLADV